MRYVLVLRWAGVAVRLTQVENALTVRVIRTLK